MGIISKTAKVFPRGKSIAHYREKGYDAKYMQELEVKIEELTLCSTALVDVECDYCGKLKEPMRYVDYNAQTKNGIKKCCCLDCAHLKQEETMMERYGCKSPLQIPEIKDKFKQTNQERYGFNSPAGNAVVKEKQKKTSMKKYGVEYPAQLKEVRDKMKRTNIERYGESYAKRFSEKAFQTFYEKTGYSNPSQSPDVQEKRTQSFIDRFGVDNPNKSPEVRKKSVQTLYKNSSQKASSQQRYICDLYDGILNYPVSYYNVDIYLKEDNITIEYDGGFHLGNVVTGRETMEEHNQKEIIRDQIIKREGYKQMRIISTKDLLPSDTTLLQMLSEAKQYFQSFPSHSWIEFNIDSSIIRNAEYKDGIAYDFGKLRRINKATEVA